VNTVKKMAQKRALVCATLLAVNASEFFTQDLEDQIIEASFTVHPEPAAPVPVVTSPDTTLLIAELRGIRKELHASGGTVRELTVGQMKAMSVDELHAELSRAREALEQARQAA
jgi:hypothetical protein